MISLSIGIGLTRTIGQAGPTNPITGTGPTLAALTDGDTLSSAVTWGSYLPAGATADRQMRVDGGAWVAYVGGTVVAEGEVWEAREVVSYGAWASTFVSAAQTVAEAASPFTARFGVGQGSGTGAFNTAYYTSTPPADGTYGPFTVSGGIITPNTTLVAGSYDVGGYPVEVLANWLAISNGTQFGALTNSDRGKTILIREAADIAWNNSSAGFLRRVAGLNTIILGDGPDPRATAWDASYDTRRHFTSIVLRATRNVTFENLRTYGVTILEPSGSGVTTADWTFRRCFFRGSRPDPNGDYSGGVATFPTTGNAINCSAGSIAGITLIDCMSIGHAVGFNIAATNYVEMIGCESWLHYEDGIKIGGAGCPVLVSAPLIGHNLGRGSDTNNPHGDGIQHLGGGTVPNLIFEAGAYWSGNVRGSGWAAPFFMDDATVGFQSLMRDCVAVTGYSNVFTISKTIGSMIEHCAWAPTEWNVLPAVGFGYARLGNSGASGLNTLKNCVIMDGGPVDGSVVRAGNVNVSGWLAGDFVAQYEDWKVGSIERPTLQQVMAGMKSKSGIAGHRVSFTGPDASSFQIAGLTAPTLTGLTVTSTTAASAAATITTDTDLNPVFWAVVPTGAAVAEPRDIKRRRITGALIYGYTSVKAGDTSITLNMAGALVAGTTYDVVAMQENGWTRVSTVARQSFTAT